MNNYCYLASVDDGDRLRVIRIGSGRNAFSGDLVRLNDGKIGEISHVIFVEADGIEYQFIADMKPIEDDWTDLYRHAEKREITHEPA